MGIVTGVVAAPFKVVKAVGNRIRVAHHENKIDDQIAPESGISGFLLDKVEDVSNLMTLGAVARVKDGIKTKGYSKMSGDDMDQALLTQYSENVTKNAEKKSEKQQKNWDKLQKKMDKLSDKDTKVDSLKQRAANADFMLNSLSGSSDEMSFG